MRQLPATGKACLTADEVGKLSCKQLNARVMMNGGCACKRGFEWNNAEASKATACECPTGKEEYNRACVDLCPKGFARQLACGNMPYDMETGPCQLASVVMGEQCLARDQLLAWGVTTPEVKDPKTGRVTKAAENGWLCVERPEPPTFGLLWANVREYWYAWLAALLALAGLIWGLWPLDRKSVG